MTELILCAKCNKLVPWWDSYQKHQLIGYYLGKELFYCKKCKPEKLLFLHKEKTCLDRFKERFSEKERGAFPNIYIHKEFQ